MVQWLVRSSAFRSAGSDLRLPSSKLLPSRRVPNLQDGHKLCHVLAVLGRPPFHGARGRESRAVGRHEARGWEPFLSEAKMTHEQKRG